MKVFESIKNAAAWALVVGSLGLAATSATHAATFRIQATNVDIYTDDWTTGSMDFWVSTAGDGATFEEVTAIGGNFFGQTIEELAPQYAFGDNDNLFTRVDPYFSSNGITFVTVEGNIYNIYVTGGDAVHTYSNRDINTVEIRTGFYTSDMTVTNLATAVPEPEAYALYLLGLVTVGAAAKRRRQGQPLKLA